MGKASRTKQDGDRRARIAAQREAERRAAQRKRIYLAGGSILVVAIVVIALVLVKLNSGSGTAAAASNGPTGAALATLTKQVEDVPASVTDQVAGGGVSTRACSSPPRQAPTSVRRPATGQSYFATVSGTALTSGGKPEVLYMGAEYCPLLRRAALGDGQRPQPLRHLHRPDDHALVEHRRRPEHADLDVLQVDVQEQLHQLHLGRGDHERADRQLHQHVGQLRDAADADFRRGGTRAGLRPAGRRSRSWTSATSTSRSATSRRSARRCWPARAGPRSAPP